MEGKTPLRTEQAGGGALRAEDGAARGLAEAKPGVLGAGLEFRQRAKCDQSDRSEDLRVKPVHR